MSAPNRSSFVYVTFIRTTAEKLWQALIDPEFTRKYWFNTTVESGWKKGSPWKLVGSDSRSTHLGAWSSGGRTSGSPSSRQRARVGAPSSSSP